MPRIAECAASVECRYDREVSVGYHSFVIVQVLCGHCREGLLDEQGYFDVVKAQVLHDAKYPLPVYALFGKYVEGK